MTNFNPNNPATSGIEWMPTRRLPKALSSGQGIGAKVTSTAAETIASVRAYLAGAAAAPVGVDIYDADDVLATQFGVLVLPVADHADSGLWSESNPAYMSGAWQPYESAGAGTNGALFVNEIVDDHYSGADITNATLDKLMYIPTTAHPVGLVTWQMDSTYYFANDGSGGAVPVNQRIAKVQISIVARNAGGRSGNLDGWITIGGAPYGSDSGPVALAANGAFTKYTFDYNWNPDTGLPWLNSDFAEFLNGGSNAFGAHVDGIGSQIVIGTVNIVFRMLPEKRVATGQAILAPAPNGAWLTFAMLDPQTGTALNWAKLNAHDYLYVFHLNRAGGAISLVGVDDSGIAGPGLTGWQGAVQFVTPTLIPSGTPVLSTWVPAMFHMTSAPALGADIQPYPIVASQSVHTSIGAIKQGMAAHSTAAYGGVRVLLTHGQDVTPTGPLVIRIRDAGTNAQVGGDATIQPSDVVYNAAGLALVTVRLASNASLASGTGYYLQFTSTTPATAPWQVVYAETDTAATTDGTTAAGGTIAGAATLNGTANALADILTNAQTAPAAPASITAASTAFVLTPSPPGGPTAINYAAVDWASTSLGGTFGYYELQRQDGGVWNPIAFVTLEANSYFNDFELPRGVATNYRVRVVRTDGAASDWTT